MRPTRLEEALEALSKVKEQGGQQVGFDSSRIQDPVQVLSRTMRVGYVTALRYLKDLESKGAIVLYREGVGRRIDSALIKKDILEKAFHEEDEDARCLKALWRHKRRSQLDANQYIVHADMFDFVRRDTDLQQALFYVTLHRLEGYGWVRLVRKGRNTRIMFAVLTEKFPIPR